MSMHQTLTDLIHQASRIVLGKERQIRLALTCLMARGHLLIEDVPGIGKTTLAHTLARLLGLDFQRIQCTNDMLPGDILGVSVFERQTDRFVFHPGPIFAQSVLVDEINRATPKTQSGLLEAMAEGQISLDRQTHPLPRPFFVIATQNPLEQAGTYPLPQSQLDRFLMRISLGYPSREAELSLLHGIDRRELLQDVQPVLNASDVLAMQAAVSAVQASSALLAYIQDILAFSRDRMKLDNGLSPRAGLALLSCARGWAFLQQRDFVLPEDIQAVLPQVIGHRLRSSLESSSTAGQTQADQLLSNVPVP
jgi:MoxR-like ATPase